MNEICFLLEWWLLIYFFTAGFFLDACFIETNGNVKTWNGDQLIYNWNFFKSIMANGL